MPVPAPVAMKEKDMKPTEAQRRALEAMRDGATMARNKHSGRYYYVRPNGMTNGIATATAEALICAGWVDTDMARESGIRMPFRLMPSGRAALSKAQP